MVSSITHSCLAHADCNGDAVIAAASSRATSPE
jgi:hypothetical protein